MKCKEYKSLIDKMMAQKLDSEESEQLTKHIEQCDDCNQDYLSAQNYQSVVGRLQKKDPVLDNKEEFIDKIFEVLPDFRKSTNSGKVIRYRFANNRFRRAISLVAAALVMFFIIQQTNDALQIQQLEAKISNRQNRIDYNAIREKSIIRVLAVGKNNTRKSLLFNKYKQQFLKKTYIKFYYRNSYLKSRLSKSLL